MNIWLDISTSQGYLIETLPALGKEFRIYVEFLLSSYAGSGESNILSFSDQGPQLYINHDDNNKLK